MKMQLFATSTNQPALFGYRGERTVANRPATGRSALNRSYCLLCFNKCLLCFTLLLPRPLRRHSLICTFRYGFQRCYTLLVRCWRFDWLDGFGWLDFM